MGSTKEILNLEEDDFLKISQSIDQKNSKLKTTVERYKTELLISFIKLQELIEERTDISNHLGHVKEKMKSDRARFVKENDSLKSDLNNSKKDYAILSQELQSTKTRLESLQIELKALKEENIASKAKLLTATSEKDKISDKLKTVEKERTDYAQKLRSVEKEKTDFAKKLGSVEKERNDYAQKLDSVEKEKNESAKKLASVKKERNDHAQILGSVQKEKTDYAKKLGNVEKERNDYAKKLESFKKERNEYVQKLESVEKERIDSTKQMEKIEREKNDVARKLENITKENDLKFQDLTKENEDLRSKLREITTEFDNLKSKMDDVPKNKEKETLKRSVQSILNKMTSQKFQSLLTQFKNLKIDTEEKLKIVIDLIFEKAIKEPMFIISYASLCKHLALIKVPTGNKEFVNFRKLLLTRCQYEFEQDRSADLKHKEKLTALKKVAPEKKKELEQEMYDQEKSRRYRRLGNIRFIGELFKLNMLTEPIMHECIKRLIFEGDEESFVGLYELLKSVGKSLDQTKIKGYKEQMETYFIQIQKIVDNRSTSYRVRFMLQDVIDLKKNKWIPRRQENIPKTIDQLHEDAIKEAREQQLKLQSCANAT